MSDLPPCPANNGAHVWMHHIGTPFTAEHWWCQNCAVKTFSHPQEPIAKSGSHLPDV